MKARDIRSSDGLVLAGYEAGNPRGLEILFIHGFSQCSHCWSNQFSSPVLANDFRLIAFDIRGHGASEKPVDLSRYADDRLFADDVHSVMEAFNLKRPVLVGWSYAGRIVSDYVEAYGTHRIAGINYVCARTNDDAVFDGPGTELLGDMIGNDLDANVRATRAFVRACFEKQPSQEDFETVVTYNMLVPPSIRRAHLCRPASDGGILAKLDVPVLVTQGSEDKLVLKGLGELTAAVVPGARLSIYDGIGHAPFAEDAARFNRELAEFVRAAQV
ncbi:MAG TPA: alpha/beta hydrolase [Aestuariivirga sp.]|nr:alpha/beta hydrolase [Aestuariivirga sp.]